MGGLLLDEAGLVLTTRAGAQRRGRRAPGLAPGESHELDDPAGRRLRVTATPARHGPEGGDRGPSSASSAPRRSFPCTTKAGPTAPRGGPRSTQRSRRPGSPIASSGSSKAAPGGEVEVVVLVDSVELGDCLYKPAQALRILRDPE